MTTDAGRLSSFRNAGLTFDVTDSGPVDGAPVVLLHGFPQRASSWAGVAAILNERGYRTFAPDQRGYSPGARPRRVAAYRMSNLVADTAALARTVSPTPVHLVGHDWGAAVAWATAAAHPALVQTLTTASVPHPAAFMRAMLSSRQALRSWYMLAIQVPWLPEWLMSRPATARRMLRHSGMSEENIERYLREIVADGALRGGLGWYRAMGLTTPRNLTRAVHTPTTFVWSDGDLHVDRRGGVLATKYVEGPFERHTLEGVTHWIPDEAPQQLADLICARIDAWGESTPSH